METWSILGEIVLLLAFCLLLGSVFSRFRQSPIIGYIIAGMILGGPGSLQIIKAENHIETISELGVALLLFSLGLEFSFSRLKSLGVKSLLSGVAQVVLTFFIAAIVTRIFGLPLIESAAVGCIVSLSSTAVVLRVLMDLDDVDSPHGRNSIAILLIQDLAVVPLAIVIALLAEGGSPIKFVIGGAKILAIATGVVVVFFLFINQVICRILPSLVAIKNRDLNVLLAIVVGLGSTWCAHAAGVSPALGAFVAGMILGGSQFSVQISADVASIKIALLTLFFGSVGVIANPVWIISNLPLVLVVTILLVFGKSVIIWLILQVARKPKAVAIATGLCLAQVGEFAFVLGNLALDGDVIQEATYMIIISGAIISISITPYLVKYAPQISLYLKHVMNRSKADIDELYQRGKISPEILIVGFGPAGQEAGRILSKKDRPVLVLDLNPAHKNVAESLGFMFQVGDASHADVLEHAHIADVKVVAVTLPSKSTSIAVITHIRRIAPMAHIIVRLRYNIDKKDFERVGANYLIVEEEEVTRKLADYVSVLSLGE